MANFEIGSIIIYASIRQSDYRRCRRAVAAVPHRSDHGSAPPSDIRIPQSFGKAEIRSLYWPILRLLLLWPP
jgi:hypothetical protein